MNVHFLLLPCSVIISGFRDQCYELQCPRLVSVLFPECFLRTFYIEIYVVPHLVRDFIFRFSSIYIIFDGLCFLSMSKQMRLAREAFNIPVYAVLQSSSQHHPADPKRGVQGGGRVGGGGVASRGRGTSPASKGGRHPDNRGSSAAMSVGRSSTPASPGNGDRPHRRTRRGGRRGRNRLEQ